MSSAGPFTSSELKALRALAEMHASSDPRATEALRLIRMIESRDAVIRTLTDAITEMQQEVQPLLELEKIVRFSNCCEPPPAEGHTRICTLTLEQLDAVRERRTKGSAT